VGLIAGTYNATITITASGATTKTIPVTLTLTNIPIITTNPTSMTFNSVVGNNPPGQSFTITNTGGGTLNWSASDNVSWLLLSSSTGTAPSTVIVSIDITGLIAGTYNGIITITASGATTKTIPVTLTLTNNNPIITTNPTSLTFNSIIGGNNPANQSFTITNTGGGTLIWSASDNVNWLLLSSSTGTAPSTVIVSVDITGLIAGTYNGIITITASGATTKTIPVTLNLTASGCDGTLYTGTLSGNGSDQSIRYDTIISGIHTIKLTGPPNTNFDLQLYKWNSQFPSPYRWELVATSQGSTSSETILYNGGLGRYLLYVISRPGSGGGGSYTICLKAP
jgi:hypothetical protein